MISQTKVTKFSSLSSLYQLPLISVIISNYNYGEYVQAAILSVRSQSYSNIELIVVDDCSSDNSVKILKKIHGEDQNFILICKEKNEGQCSAFYDGLKICAGQYVVFLDADDILLEEFIKTHVLVNLSLRVPVGLTCSDLLQTSGDYIVNGSFPPISNFVRKKRKADIDLFRDMRDYFPELFSPESNFSSDLCSKIYFYKSGTFNDWAFAPTSGCFYRRDALDLVLDKKKLKDLKLNADTYLNKSIALITGAIIIDVPLTVRRIHASNGFVDMAELNGLSSIDPKKVYISEYYTWIEIVNLLLENANKFILLLGFGNFADLLFTMQKQRVCLPKHLNSDELAEYSDLSDYINSKIDEHCEDLSSLLGEPNAISYLKDGISKYKIIDNKKNKILKLISELCLTVGRFGLPKFQKIGEFLWNKSGY